MDDRLEEILRRLEALERKVEAASGRKDDAVDCPFRSDERRIVDLIVRLVAERTERGDRGYHPPPPPEPPPHPRRR